MLTLDDTFGIVAEYASPYELVEAVKKVRAAGFTKIDTHTPFPIHGMDKAMGLPGSRLPWFVLGWKRESEKLQVGMFEEAVFARGKANLPARAQVVIEADDKMQFYEAVLQVRAQFGGLRKLMYNHRILSYLVFTAGFFCVSVASLLMAYFALGFLATPAKEEAVKQEEDEDVKDQLSTAGLSDTPRQFPTRHGQAPLRYSRRDDDDVEIKQEVEEPTGIHPLTAEADDEDDDSEDAGASSWRDSGIGTGRESERRGIQRRRKSSRDGEF